MAAPSEGFWQRRGLFGLYELLQSWWRHRVSFLISVFVTFLALALYYFTFVGERPTPIFNFIQRLEFASLDTRFRYRPRGIAPVDPRIVIVDIDQHSQEVLGKWPFSRVEFFQRARSFYCARKLQDAQAAFQGILDKWPDDGPSRAYWKRCQEYFFEEPPSDWDGVFTMTHK